MAITFLPLYYTTCFFCEFAFDAEQKKKDCFDQSPRQSWRVHPLHLFLSIIQRVFFANPLDVKNIMIDKKEKT